MKKILITILGAAIAVAGFAQEDRSVRTGFAFGGFVGMGAVHFTEGNIGDQTQGLVSFPNLMAGYMINSRFGIFLKSVGHNYELDGRDRSFDSYVFSAQYWPADDFWISGGYGPSMDVRAFYESKRKSEGVNWGHGILIAGGYEFLQRKKWALDLQSRLHLAGVKLDDNTRREGSSFTLGLGVTFF